jgi:hypothetical protein
VVQRSHLWPLPFAHGFFVSIAPMPTPVKHSSCMLPPQALPQERPLVAKPIANARFLPVNSQATQQ